MMCSNLRRFVQKDKRMNEIADSILIEEIAIIVIRHSIKQLNSLIVVLYGGDYSIIFKN